MQISFRGQEEVSISLLLHGFYAKDPHTQTKQVNFQDENEDTFLQVIQSKATTSWMFAREYSLEQHLVSAGPLAQRFLSKEF